MDIIFISELKLDVLIGMVILATSMLFWWPLAQLIHLAQVGSDDVVLDVGCATGYSTAVLAQVAARVIGLEPEPELAEAARANLAGIGLHNAEIVSGPLAEGWAPAAPYDAIVVSAVAPEVPVALGEQLAEGGRLVIPVASSYSDDVVLYRKVNGVLKRSKLVSPARFVPLVREERSE